jgi:hypothetical protein
VLGDVLVVVTGLVLLGLAGTGVYLFVVKTWRRRGPLPTAARLSDLPPDRRRIAPERTRET